MLSLKGYHECPFLCGRWDLVSNDPYGRSPAMDALGDVKQLQLEQKRKAQGIDKQVNPPMVADVSLKNQPASTLPGGITYVNQTANNSAGFKPVYEVQPDIRGMMEDIKECQTRIKDTFFNDLFLMISQLDTVRTATEIQARREEKLVQLGPVLERFQNEVLGPAIDRIFAIMMRAKLIPPAPKRIQGVHLKVQYVSILAAAQKATVTTSIEQLLKLIGETAETFPEAKFKVDINETIDDYSEALNVRPKIVVPSRKAEKLYQNDLKQRAAQAAQAQGLAAAQGAQTLSKTDVGGGQNALQMMLASGAGAQQGAR
jgi:hypothetical protein